MLGLIEKEILKFLSNIDSQKTLDPKVISLLEIWRKYYQEIDLDSITKESLNIFFGERGVDEGRDKLRFYLSKIDPSLLEVSSWSLEDLLKQSRLFITDGLTKKFAIKFNQTTFLKEDLEKVQDLVHSFLNQVSQIGEDSYKIWSPGVKEEIPLEDSLPSPFPDLIPDFRKKRFYIIAGLPGEGKTFFVINLADFFIKKGLSVLHVSLETGIPELLSRYLSLWSGQSISCWSPEIFDQVYFDGVKSLSIVEIASFSSVGIIDHLLSIRNADVLLLDYLDLLASFRSLDNLFLEFSEVSRSLYYIAKKRNICVISTSQLNREGEISRSFGKKEICDGLLTLKRLNDSELQLYVEKLRYGPDKKFKVFKYDFSKAKIYFEPQVFSKTWEIKG